MARFDIEIGKKGNGATDVSRSIDEIINKLSNAEKYSEIFNNSLKGQQTVLRAYEGALKNLISHGFDRLDPSIKAVKAEIDKLTASINTQKSTLADQKAIDNLNIKLKQIASSESLMSNETAKVSAQIRAFQAAINALIKNGADPADVRIKSLQNTVAGLNGTLLNLKATDPFAQFRKTGQLIPDLERKVRSLQAALSTATNPRQIAQYNIRLRDANSELNRLRGLGLQSGNAVTQGMRNATASTQQLNEAIRTTGNTQASVGTKMKGGGFLGGMASQAGALIASLTSVYAVLNTLKSAFNTALKTDALATSFSFVIEESEERLDALVNSANRLGVQFLTLAETNRQFIAAAKASNFNLEEADKIFNSVANAGAKLKLSNEQISGTFLAIEQMISKGTVSMEELRRQLGDRLPGAFAMAARAMGLTESQFNKMVAAGEVMSKDLLPKLADELDKVYGNSQYQKIESMQASMNRLKNTFTEIVMESGIASSVFAPFLTMIETAIRGLSGLSNAADESFMKFKATEEVFLQNKQRLQELTGEYSNAKQSVIETGEGHGLLQKVMNEIADLMPGAVTDWDNYGNAIGISTTRINELTEAQRELLEVMNREAISDISKPLNKALVDMQAAQGWIDRMTQRGVTEIKEGGGIFPGDGYDVNLEDQRRRFKEAQADVVKYLKTMQDLGATLSPEQNSLLAYFGLDAGGQAMRDYKDSLKETAKTIEDAVRLINSASSKVELDELESQFAQFAGQRSFEDALKDKASQLDKFSKEAESTLKRVMDFLKDSDFSISLLGMDERGRAEAQIRKRYESIISSVKIGSDEYVRLNENMNIEIEASNKKFADADSKLISDMVQKRAKAIQDQAAKIVAANEKEYQDLLKAHQNYLEKIQEIEEKYDDAISRARSEGRDSEANEMARSQAKEIADIYKQEIEDSEPFQALEESLKNSSLKVARAALSSAKSAANAFIEGIEDPKVKAAVEKFFGNIFNDIDVELRAENFDVVTDLVNGFEKLVDQAGSFDDSMAKSLKTISGMVSVVGDIANTLAKSSKNPLFQNISGSAGIIAGTIGIIGGIAGAIEQRQARKAAEEAERMQKQNEQSIRVIDSMTKSLQRQLEVIELIYGVERVTEWQRVSNEAAESVEKSLAGMSDIIVQDGPASGAVEALRRFGLDTVSELDEEIERLEKRIKRNKWNPFVDVSKDQVKLFELKNIKTLLSNDVIPSYEFGWEKISDITQEGAEQIRKDIEEGKFDEVTAKELSAMLEQWQIYMNAQRKLMEEFTGSSLDSIIQDTTSLFFNAGEDSAEAWSKGFDKIMENYLIRKFQRDFLEKEMEAWYDKFAKYAEDGLDESEKEELRRDREGIGQRGDQFLDDITDALGYDPRIGESGADGGSDSGLRGSIERMSEQTGSELTGIYRASYELSKESLGKLHFIDVNMNALVGINGQQLSVLEGIKEDTEQIAEHTSFLEDMNYTLVEIAENTRSAKGKSERDLG